MVETMEFMESKELEIVHEGKDEVEDVILWGVKNLIAKKIVYC